MLGKLHELLRKLAEVVGRGRGRRQVVLPLPNERMKEQGRAK